MLALWEVGSKRVVHVSGGQRCCCALWRQYVALSCHFGNFLSSPLHDFGGEARAGHSWVLPGASGTFHSGQEEGSWSLSRESQILCPYLLWFPWVASYLITRDSEIPI